MCQSACARAARVCACGVHTHLPQPDPDNPRHSFSDDFAYDDRKPIGCGAFSEVFLGMDKSCGAAVAVKRCYIPNMQLDDVARLREVRAAEGHGRSALWWPSDSPTNVGVRVGVGCANCGHWRQEVAALAKVSTLVHVTAGVLWLL